MIQTYEIHTLALTLLVVSRAKSFSNNGLDQLLLQYMFSFYQTTKATVDMKSERFEGRSSSPEEKLDSDPVSRFQGRTTSITDITDIYWISFMF